MSRRLVRRWATLIGDQWVALKRGYPVHPDPSGWDAAKVLGLYLLAGAVLTLNHFGSFPLARWAAATFLPEPWVLIARRSGWALVVAFVYVVPTAAYARWVLGLRLDQLGLRLRGFVEHLPLYVLFLGVVAPFVVYASSLDTFLHTYPLAHAAGRSWWFLGIWLFAYAVQFVGVEFFFRGYLLFGAARFLGPWVLPVMVVPYVMLHFQKPMLEALGSALAGLALGVVALRTGSILAGVSIHVAVAWSMDLLALWHKGDLGRLLAGPDLG